jgi:hypothetical protein
VAVTFGACVIVRTSGIAGPVCAISIGRDGEASSVKDDVHMCEMRANGPKMAPPSSGQ